MNYFDNLKIDYESESLTNQLQDLKLHDIIKNKYKSIKAGWFKINLGAFIAVIGTLVIIIVIAICRHDMLKSKVNLINLSEKLTKTYNDIDKQLDTFNIFNIPVLKSFHTSEIFRMHNYLKKGAKEMGPNIFKHGQKLSVDFINESIFMDNVYWVFDAVFLVGVYFVC